MHERTHVDLFSGIGGFALAASWNGVRTVQFCEVDRRCREFLARAWPGVPIHDDIRTFALADGQEIARRNQPKDPGDGNEWQGRDEPGEAIRDSVWLLALADGEQDGPDRTGAQDSCTELRQSWTDSGRDPVWLLTGGVPCQPASRAGKQRGAADDRWLWPEAVRVLAALRPTWVCFENPPGIGDVGLAGVLAEMEAVGYQVRVLGIPACAVGAPHRRERYWIMGHGMADASQPGREGTDAEPGTTGLCAEHRQADWSDFIWLPCADGKVRRAPGDSVGLVDGLHRSILGALGNSIVPQVAARIIAAMIQAEEEP